MAVSLCLEIRNVFCFLWASFFMDDTYATMRLEGKEKQMDAPFFGMFWLGIPTTTSPPRERRGERGGGVG